MNTAKKKIYFLINSLEWWGAERVITTLAGKMVDAFDVTLITLKRSWFYELPSWVRYHSLSTIKNNLLMFFLIPRYVYKLRKLLKKEQFFTGVSFLEIANFTHILAKKHAIISFRIHIDFFVWFVWTMYKFFIRWLYPKAKTIIVNAEENRYDLAHFLHVPLSKIRTIYNPVDVEKIEKLKYEKIDDDILHKIEWKRVFVTTWRLVRQKHHKKIISALGKVYDTLDQNRIYMIVGDGPEKKDVQQLTHDLWLSDRIIFLGQQKNVFAYLRLADYFLYASEYEWFPNVMLEAMICWNRIVTSDFKSWAKELILDSYTKDVKVDYPYIWERWILLDLQKFEEQFIAIYPHLATMKSHAHWMEKFTIENVVAQWKALLS